MATVRVATRDGVRTFGDGIEAAAPVTELAGRRVDVLVHRGGAWWAVVEHRTIVRRDDTAEWTDVATAETPIRSLLPAAGGAWCGTGDSHLLRLHDGRLAPVPGFDAVAGRETWHAVPSGEPYVRALTVTADDRALLAAVHVGGIPRSGNGGASWKPTLDVETDVHEVRAHPVDPTLVLAPAGYGLAVSRDAGATWTVTTEGLHATYARAVAFTTDAALVSVADGPVGGTSALYRWTDGPGTGTLERVTAGLPEWFDANIDTGALDAHGEAAALADAGIVYASRDGGRSWTVLAQDLGPVHAVAVGS